MAVIQCRMQENKETGIRDAGHRLGRVNTT